MNRKLLYIGLAVALMACGSEEEKKKEDTDSKRPLVIAEAAEKRDFKHQFDAQGIVEATNNVVLTAETGGVITSIKVKEGTKVKKNTTLVVVDASIVSKNIDEVNQALIHANYVLEKQKALFDQNVGSELDYKNAENQVLSLEKKLETLKAQRSKAIVSAPFEGVVDEIFPSVGEMAGPTAPLLRLIDLSKIEVSADVPENYLGVINVGDMVTIEFPSIKGLKTYEVPITRIGKYIKPDNRTFKVHAEIKNTDEKLLPNLVALVKITDYTSNGKVFVVDNNAIQFDNKGNQFIYKCTELESKDKSDTKLAVVNRVPVEKGASAFNEQTERMESIVNGALTRGDYIMVEGARGVSEGDTVRLSISDKY